MEERETEEEMLKKVAAMQGVSTEEAKDEEGALLERENLNMMPNEPVETGLSSEEDLKGEDEPEEDPEDKDEPELQEEDLTVINAKKRIHDAQTKMHMATTAQANAEALLKTATEKIQSYENIISKTGSTPATQAAQETAADVAVEAAGNALEGLEALKEEYPEIATPFIAVFDKMQKKMDAMEKAQGDIANTSKQSIEAIEANAHFAKIAEFHPDYMSVDNSPEFAAWIETLPAFEKSAVLNVRQNGTADESISMLDRFKKDTGHEVAAQSDNKLEAAKAKVSPSFNKATRVNLRSGEQVPLTMEEMRKMAPSKENEERILMAMMSGAIK